MALALGGMQLVPLGQSVRNFLSPQVTKWRKMLAPDDALPTELPPDSRSIAVSASKTATPVSDFRPLSIYPAATRRQLTLLSMAAIAFTLGARFFRHRRAQLILCFTAAINGAAIATLGIVQRISGDYSYLGGSQERKTSFGSFFNENNGAGYLNLCLACALAVLCWLLVRHRSSQASLFAAGIPLEPPTAASRLSAAWVGLRAGIAGLTASALAIWLVLGLLLAGVLCSLSRGAWLAAAVAAPLALFAIRRQKGLKSAWISLGIAAAISVALICWLGASKLIERRSTSLLNISSLLDDDRISNWAESLRALGDYWLLGSGLGTYGYAYLPYQQGYNNAWHLHAENQYLEALVDGGVVGLALLACEIGLVLLALRKILSDRSEPANAGLVAAGVFLVCTQSLHALMDFGLYLPANFLLAAVLCGGFCGRAALLSQNPLTASHRRWLALPAGPVIAPILLVGLSAAAVLSWQETSRAAAVESALTAARWDETRQVTKPQLEGAIDRLSAATRRRWDDGQAHLRLAQLWIHLYRLQAFAQLQKESPGADENRLWSSTDIAQLHARAAELASVQNEALLDRLREQSVIVKNLDEAWKHLIWARQACPWLSDIHLDLAALCFLAGDPARDVGHLDAVRLLAPYDPDYLYAVGVLDL
ncbi:MAG TPA: O-antigen ligase family protein, partial [Pirellulales bacterium]|nr:O-antigen ligase family protein [Pirellulales bacterium]